MRDPTDGSGLLFPGDEPEFANAAVAHGGFLYAFGCTLAGLSRPCALGRAPLDRPNDRAAWTFYDGAGWSSSLADAAHLFDGAPIMEVSYDDALGRWLLVYSGMFEDGVIARTAPELTGPWSRPITLFQPPEGEPYDAVLHGELAEDGGRVEYISYSHATDGWFGSEHALWRLVLAPPG